MNFNVLHTVKSINKYFEQKSEYKLISYGFQFMRTSEFCIVYRQVPMLMSNRFSFSKKFIGNDFHNQWKKNVEKYDKWLIEKIEHILNRNKIDKVCICWNQECLPLKDVNAPRHYIKFGNGWVKEINL